jgi:hypothetical protein
MSERQPGGMKRKPLVVLAVVAALTGSLTACSSGGNASPSPSPSTSGNVQQWLELARRFSQCARDHGYPAFPDPVLDNGEPVYSTDGADVKEQALAVAEIPECKAIDEQLAALRDANGPTYSAADVQKLIQFAGCIREHGVPEWPDPKADGTFPIVGTPLEAEGKSDRVLAAADACLQYWGKGISTS